MLTVEDVDVALKKFKLKPTEVLTIDSKASPDDIGYCWADAREIPLKSFPIVWEPAEGCKTVKTNKWGKPYNYAAAQERITKMLANCDGVLIFWSEDGSEAENFIKQAKKLDIPVYFAKPNPEYVVE